MIWTGESKLCLKYVNLMMQGQVPNHTTMITSIDADTIWKGQTKSKISEEQYNRYNYQKQDMSSVAAGGTSIFKPGTVMIMHLDDSIQKCDDFTFKCYDLIINNLKKDGYIQSCQIQGNDLFINNKKLSGLTHGVMPNGICFGAFAINLKVNNKAIDKICIQNEPYEIIGLAEFGYTTEDIINWFKEFWKDEKWEIKTE